MKTLLVLLLIVACSSAKENSSVKAPEKVTNEDFKKERALSPREVPEFYGVKTATMNPALQDETLDRYSKNELSDINSSSDPLASISVLCSQRNFDEAFQLASQSFDKYQKIPAYWNQIANCHLNQGSHRKALLFYNKALEVKPNFVPALNNIGVMYSRQGLEQKALVAFERANKISKFSKTPRFNLASTYLSFGLVEEALPIFQGLLGDAPEDVGLLNAVGSSYFLMSDYRQALGYFKRIPQKFWQDPEIGLNLAMTLKKLNQTEDARQIFSNIEKPTSAELKRYYAVIGTKIGDAK